MSDSPRSRSMAVFVGVLRIARGRPDGLLAFGATRQAFLTSLAPLIAFPLVASLLRLMSGEPLGALADLASMACALLAPPVLSFELARLWGRESNWSRYATAFNWSQWALPIIGSILLVALGMAMAAGMTQRTASELFFLGLGGYGLWLHWFLVRHGLGLRAGRSMLFVLGVNLGTVFIVMAPRLLTMDRG
jgi:hypothetical protein